ncbi:MAG: hypothetical protein WC233_01455 [Sphaerochaeta sp.]|nr:hypothetical protein [Spirochaetales bacterium]
MRRALALLSFLLLSSALLGASFSFKAEALVDEAYALIVEKSLLELLVQRRPSSVELTATLSDDLTLHIEGNGESLSTPLPQQEGEVEAFLIALLGWDGARFFDPLEGGRLSYPTKGGFMLTDFEGAKEGERFWAFDADGRRVGSLLLTHSADQSQVAVQRSGRALLPHMAVGRTSTFDFGVYANLSLSLGWGAEIFVHHWRTLHPFFLSAAILYHSVDGIGLRLGVGATLPMSQLFGTRSHLARNLSVEGWAGTSLGYAQDLVVSADGRIGLSYHFDRWKITALVGNRIGVSKGMIVDQGLFFTVGTAYTMSR